MAVSIAASKKIVHGTSRVSFALDRASDRIVFRLWPNMPVQRQVGARLDVENVRVDGAAVTTTEPDPTTLVLARPVQAGERVTVSMSWTLRLPRTPTERLASRFGVRLGSFFPLLAWSGSEWALDPPAAAARDVDVASRRLRRQDRDAQRDARRCERGQRGQGALARSSGAGLRARSREFKVARRIVRVPSPVVVTVAAASKDTYLPTYLNAAARALTTFSQRYGPYPWSTYTVIVEADRSALGDEYPTLVFISTDLPANVVTHETAHQWFYSLVGDDQARDPWLDESLAEWATARLWATSRPRRRPTSRQRFGTTSASR